MLRRDCLPSSRGHVRFVQPDDDLHYTVLSLLLAEAKGLDFTPADVGWSLLDNVPYHFLWFAERQVYYQRAACGGWPEGSPQGRPP